MITTTISSIIKSLNDNDIVCIPTDTVYGLSCSINTLAVNKLIKLKQRNSSKGFIIISNQSELLLKYVDTTLLTNEQILKLQTPQALPTTWITPATKDIQWLTGAKSTIAIRLVQTPVIQEICSALDDAIISTSANISGQTFINDTQIISSVFDNIKILNNGTKNQTTPSSIINILTGEKIR